MKKKTFTGNGTRFLVCALFFIQQQQQKQQKNKFYIIRVENPSTLIEVDIHKFSHFSCCSGKNESQTEVKEEEEKMIELSEQ